MSLRKSVFSGSWYPDSEKECKAQIERFLDEGSAWNATIQEPSGGIVPHAGWYFSGSVACNVIERVSRGKSPDIVIVFGMHLHEGSPNYIMAEGAWETPFGELAVGSSLAGALTRRFSFVEETAGNFIRDNTIELQLPFIKYFFSNAKVVTIGVPPSETSLEIGEAAVDIAGEKGLDICVIGSTDLTHYGPNYGFTSKGTGKKAFSWAKDENDKQVIDAMAIMDPGRVIRLGLASHNACCAGAAATAIACGKRMGAQKAELLTYANSYDKSPGDSFVGYAGMVF